MSTILDTIIAAKKRDLEKRKPAWPVSRLEQEGIYWNQPVRSLASALMEDEGSGIIAEFKRKSPSRGWFKPPEQETGEVVKAYGDYGASAVSVLTDAEFFGGSLDDLMMARQLLSVPLLRKDFIVEEWQIAEARAFGADVILLIAACLSAKEVKQLAAYATGLGLEVLLELHEENELDHICEATRIVGINNRNLKTFEVDIDRSLRMAEQIPSGKIKVAESGISSVEAIRLFRKAGFRGFLIGENFMKSDNPGKAFRQFVAQLNAK